MGWYRMSTRILVNSGWCRGIVTRTVSLSLIREYQR